jgi:hypothetical protein
MGKLFLAAFALSGLLFSVSYPAHAQFGGNDLLRMGTKVLRELSSEPAAHPRANNPQKLPATSSRSFSRAEIREIQRGLNDRGYAAGEADGALGPKTRHAITEFQRDAGLAVTGRPDESLLAALRAPTGETQPETAVPSNFTTLRGFDLPYNDYRNGMNDPALKGISQDDCQTLCAQDNRCLAFTYNTQSLSGNIMLDCIAFGA